MSGPSENETRMWSRWKWAQTGQLWLWLPGGQSWVGGNHLDRDNRLAHWPLPMLTPSDQGDSPHNLHLIFLLDSIVIILKIMFDSSELDYELHSVLSLIMGLPVCFVSLY